MRLLLLSCLFVQLVVSCKHEMTDGERFAAYLKELKIPVRNTDVVIVNPAFCGACTKETMNWIISFDKAHPNSAKYLLKTQELNDNFLAMLQWTNFKQVLVSDERIQRLGFGGAVSNFVKVESNDVTEKKVIKGIPG